MEKKSGSKSRTFAVTVTTESTPLVKENPQRTGLIVYNNGTATIYVLSAQNLKTTDGIPVLKGEPYENTISTAPYWAIADSGSQDVRVEEVSE